MSDGLNRQLTDVELRLSRMVSGPPAQWQTDPLFREAEQLLTQAQTVAERDAVKVTLNKVERFAAIGAATRKLPAEYPRARPRVLHNRRALHPSHPPRKPRAKWRTPTVAAMMRWEFCGRSCRNVLGHLNSHLSTIADR